MQLKGRIACQREVRQGAVCSNLILDLPRHRHFDRPCSCCQRVCHENFKNTVIV